MVHMLRSDISRVIPPPPPENNETWLDWLISEGMEIDRSIVN